MRSIKHLGMRPAGLPLLADEVIEFHAARLLLLFKLCGTAGRIDGLTKMAKLDFFARYPDFFEIARSAVARPAEAPAGAALPQVAIESAMVRHHYGPWDKRYYQVLALLESKGLITISKEGNSYRLSLTKAGGDRAAMLAQRPSFAALVARMKDIKSVFGGKSGSALKDLIYRLFNEEIARRPMGEMIE